MATKKPLKVHRGRNKKVTDKVKEAKGLADKVKKGGKQPNLLDQLKKLGQDPVFEYQMIKAPSNQNIITLKITEEAFNEAIKPVFEAGAKQLGFKGVEFKQVSEPIRIEYIQTGTFIVANRNCMVKGKGKDGKDIPCASPEVKWVKNFYRGNDYIGFISMCEECKKAYQKQDIDKGLKFTEI